MRITFERLSDGAVKLEIHLPDHIRPPFQPDMVFTAEEWSHIVASVAKYGETVANEMLAKQLHDGNIHSIALLDEKYRKVTECGQ